MLAADMVHVGCLLRHPSHVWGSWGARYDPRQRCETETNRETSADTCGKNCEKHKQAAPFLQYTTLFIVQL